ncbi:MAG: hypothetical protein KDN22_26320 [Verrucomicrobiae bacterium]|nr:hypothetical protein [Verrucomicrobiae bacterium]
MSEPTENKPRMRKEPVSGFSPTPGCIIIICGLLMVVGFLIWAGFTFVRQNRAIDEFTEKTPVEIVPPSVDAAAKEAVIAKLVSIAVAVNAKTEGEISLTADELNTVLALDRFADKKVNTVIRVLKIADGAIHCQISFPLNGFPPGTLRYLNGTLLCHPEIKKDTGLVILTDDIQVPGKVVAEGFLSRYRQEAYLDQMVVGPFRDDEDEQGKEIATVLKAITDVEIKGDQVIIRYVPTQQKK